MSLPTDELRALLTTYGYLVVFAFVLVECVGVPLPAETMLLLAAVYAGATHEMEIELVIAAAAAGAIAGDNLGYGIGRVGGFRLLTRYGTRIGLDERKIKLGEYLFMRYGGRVVFAGRWIPVVRMLASFLAGTNRMPWRRFLTANMAGGIAWSCFDGLLAYYLGDMVDDLSREVGAAFLAGSVIIAIGFAVFIHKNEQRLQGEANKALPGPLRTMQREAI